LDMPEIMMPLKPVLGPSTIRVGLKLQLQRQLDRPRPANLIQRITPSVRPALPQSVRQRLRRITEQRAGQHIGGIAEIGVIKDVEELRPETKPYSFGDAKHRGLFRYSRILQREDGARMPIPVALIPDRDVPPDVAKKLVGDQRTEGDYTDAEKQAHIESLVSDEGGCVRAFPSEQWTLEFDLARQPELALVVHQAVKLAKGALKKTAAQVKAEAAAEIAAWKGVAAKSADEVATEIYTPLKNRTVSKAQVAEHLAKLIEELEDDPATFRKKVPNYLAQAIDHATGVTPATEGSQKAPDDLPITVPGGVKA